MTGSRQFEVRETPDPVVPEDGLVLKVEACGVCGSDLRRWREGPPAGVDNMIPGHEVSGVVTAAGPRAVRFGIGDRLAIAPDIHCGRCWYCERGLFNLCDNIRLLGITPGYPGGFAEKMALTGEALVNGIVHRVPDGLSDEFAAMAEPCSSVLAAHMKANSGLDDTVVIIGAGPIGCLHVAVAKARGAAAIIIDRSTTRLEMVERVEPDASLNATQMDVVARVRELTNGLGADVAICANPDPSTQAEAVRMVRKGGRVVLFGGLPKANPNTTLNGNLIHYGEIEVVGAFSYHPTAHAMALDLFHRGILPVDRLITHRFPLDQVGQAFATADSGEGLKVIVKP
ncbi:MAG: alcohol dehydrogenase catalytic domain-containing protein [Anaerolineales bacterium]|nr:alcohol dehydrogenase catalytic domain-containing protein [Anaerolineales bacterium]